MPSASSIALQKKKNKGGDQLDAEAINGPGGYEHVLLRMEAQEIAERHKISEEMARAELESMQREARHAFFRQNHQFQEHQRHAREAFCRAVRESSENYEFMMVQELQSLQERRTKGKDGGTFDCIRSTIRPSQTKETIYCRNNKHSFREERANEVLKGQFHSEMQSQVEGFRKVMREQEVQQQQQGLESKRTIEAPLRARLHSEEQKVASMKESLEEILEGETGGKKSTGKHVILQE